MASAWQVIRARQAVPSLLRWNWWALLPLMLALMAIAVPWLIAHSPEIGFALQRSFALVCHQQADRSFFLFGGAVAVCARCFGIYLGATAGLLVRVQRRVATWLLIVAIAMNGADWLAEISGPHRNWMFVRFSLGIALGMGGAMLVAASCYPRIACTNSVAPIATSPA